MAEVARKAGVSVFMGYNRNFSEYVRHAHVKTMEIEKDGQMPVVTMGRNDCFAEEDLDECFERNAEGMLKNMMCHELMVLVTYFGLTEADIKDIIVDQTYLLQEVRRGFTDFRKVGFTILMSNGRRFKLWGDRCGGEYGEFLLHIAG